MACRKPYTLNRTPYTVPLSDFFLNDTLDLVSTPLTLQLTRSLKLNPVPYLLAIAGAPNIG